MTETKQITEEQAKRIFKRIETYLKTRLGKGNSFYLTIKDIKADHIIVESEVINPNDLGRFSLVIEEYYIRAIIWLEPEHDCFNVHLYYYFDLTGGGSNGIEIPFKLRGSIDNDFLVEI